MSLNTNDLFDAEFYLANNSDVAAAVNSEEIDALQHFQDFGQFEGRDPSTFFNTQFYLTRNLDVAEAITRGTVKSAIAHYLQFGQFEGRNPIPQFNSSLYLEQNSDVAKAIDRDRLDSAYEHYILYGRTEPRSGSPVILENGSISSIFPGFLNVELFSGQVETRQVTVSLPPNSIAPTEIEPIVTSDEFGYVREIRSSQFGNLQTGQVYEFDVTLQGRGRNDALNIQFPSLGSIQFNLQSQNERSQQITANFVNSETDEKLTAGVQRTGGQPPEFPYGVLPTDLGINFERINQREIKLFSVPPTVISPTPNPAEPGKVWVISHGWNDNPDDRSDTDLAMGNLGDFTDLAEALANANSNDTVLLLDWRQAAAGGKLNQFDSNLNALLKLGNYTAAKWIRPVAEFTVKALEFFGINAQTALTNLNLIGHSLGSLLSNEIARIYQAGFTDEGGNVFQGNGTGVNAIVALDPPSQTNLSLFSAFVPGIGYDIDGRTPEADFIDPNLGIYVPKFAEVSNFSRSFVGSKSLAGNQLFSEQADESIQLDFGTRFDLGEEHIWVVQNYKNLIDSQIRFGEISKLFQPIPIAQILTPSPTFTENAYTNSIGGKHDASIAIKPPTSNLEFPQPIALIFKNISGDDDDIVYGTSGDDILDSSNVAFVGGDSRFSSTGNDIFYGDAGNDRILGGSGNDTVEGSAGKDTINGEQDSDRISGGAGDDYIFGGRGQDLIFGDENNDTLEGNNDSDTVFGGTGDDRIWGGGDNSSDYLHGGSENDTLTGEGGTDTLIGGAGNDRLEGNNEDDILIGGRGRDTMSGGLGRDTFVFAPGDGSLTLSDADIIEDYRSGILVTFGSRTRVGDVRGVSQIQLTGGLSPDRIQTEKIGNDTILRANSEVLAILQNVDVRQNELVFVL